MPLQESELAEPNSRRLSGGSPAAHLQAMLDQVTEGLAMFDRDGTLVAWNMQLLELLTLPEELLGQRVTLEGFIRHLAERGDFGTTADAAEVAVREHMASPGEPCTVERMMPDGRVLEFRRSPSPDGSVMVSYRDVTERRHTEYMLQDSTRELRAILEKAPVALAVIGQEDGQLKHVNARFRRLFGLNDLKAALQMPLGSFVGDEDRDRILSPQDHRSVDFETSVRCADGTEFWALISSIRFVFEWEPATLTSFHDISDRKRAEAGLREELDRKQAELSEARVLQLELTPPPFRGVLGRFDVALDVVLEPAKEVGGDLVDYFPVGDDLMVLVLGDVSNKGAGAALMMARTHSIMRGLASRPDAETLFRAPEHAVDMLNSALCRSNETCMFVSLLLACFDARTGTLAYVCAGHIPPFLHRASGVMERLEVLGGPLVGVRSKAKYKSAPVTLAPGDHLLIVTDGITEAIDPVGNQFGEDRVAEFHSAVPAGGERPLGRLTEQVRTFEAGQPAFDDVAAIFFEISNPSDN